ncbi:hypothetical protein [Modestobacter lacusdianchii]
MTSPTPSPADRDVDVSGLPSDDGAVEPADDAGGVTLTTDEDAQRDDQPIKTDNA